MSSHHGTGYHRDHLIEHRQNYDGGNGCFDDGQSETRRQEDEAQPWGQLDED